MARKPTTPTNHPSMTSVLDTDTTLVAAPVNSGRPVRFVGAALPLLGTKNPTDMVTTGAGGGRFSGMMGVDAIGVTDTADDGTGVAELEVL